MKNEAAIRPLPSPPHKKSKGKPPEATIDCMYFSSLAFVFLLWFTSWSGSMRPSIEQGLLLLALIALILRRRAF